MAIEKTEGHTVYTLSGAPKTEAIARQLGYGGFRAEVDGNNWAV